MKIRIIDTEQKSYTVDKVTSVRTLDPSTSEPKELEKIDSLSVHDLFSFVDVIGDETVSISTDKIWSILSSKE
ncbi:hypothetical protein [Oenococcus sp.]|uniref:hypothetical protein n=1 Tax=Oenococcus sp. TaxID=1979414 RepID=UPI0039E8CC8E